MLIFLKEKLTKKWDSYTKKKYICIYCNKSY